MEFYAENASPTEPSLGGNWTIFPRNRSKRAYQSMPAINNYYQSLLDVQPRPLRVPTTPELPPERNIVQLLDSAWYVPSHVFVNVVLPTCSGIADSLQHARGGSLHMHKVHATCRGIALGHCTVRYHSRGTCGSKVSWQAGDLNGAEGDGALRFGSAVPQPPGSIGAGSGGEGIKSRGCCSPYFCYPYVKTDGSKATQGKD